MTDCPRSTGISTEEHVRIVSRIMRTGLEYAQITDLHRLRDDRCVFFLGGGVPPHDCGGRCRSLNVADPVAPEAA